MMREGVHLSEQQQAEELDSPDNSYDNANQLHFLLTFLIF